MTAIHDPVGNVRHGEAGTLATLLLGKEHSAPLWRHWARSCHLAQARAHAIFHATGKRIRELPITPNKLL
jgi:hypothetical protein